MYCTRICFIKTSRFVVLILQVPTWVEIRFKYATALGNQNYRLLEYVHRFRKLLIKTVVLVSEQGAGKSSFKKPKSCISDSFHVD